jgi:hypothetical protein
MDPDTIGSTRRALMWKHIVSSDVFVRPTALYAKDASCIRGHLNEHCSLARTQRKI